MSICLKNKPEDPTEASREYTVLEEIHASPHWLVGQWHIVKIRIIHQGGCIPGQYHMWYFLHLITLCNYSIATTNISILENVGGEQ